jgi:hypothetical protein
VSYFRLASAAVIVARFALTMPAVVITWFAFATSDIGVAALVITALTMAAVVITWFAFAAGDIGVAALVVTALTMAAVVITWLTFARQGAHRPIIVAMAPLTVSTAIIASATQALISAVSTNHMIGSTAAAESATGDALMDGPAMHATTATAHAHAGRTPTARLTGSTGEECKSGCDHRHSRTHD